MTNDKQRVDFPVGENVSIADKRGTPRGRLVEILKECPSNYSEDIADYLLANGVIAPPCKVGQTVYVGNIHTAISEIIVGKEINFMCYFDCEWVMENVGCGDCPFAEWHETYEGDIDCQTYGCFSFSEKDIGKTVFLTKEEAEEALKGGVQG